jgi:2'-5' RNA ligase
VSGLPAPILRDRLFFALWPDEALERRLMRLVDRVVLACGGRGVAAGKLHLTLVFLGDVERERVAPLRALAASVNGPQVELTLDRLGYWHHNLIAWAGTSAVPEALAGLVAALEARLRAAGYAFDRRPYVPHVTLARNARCRGRLTLEEPLLWRADEFVLVRSTRGNGTTHYEAIGRWPLGG